jgi:hypothetical protein
VIVRPDRLAFSARLVPVDLIAEASEQGIRLRCTRNELRRLECFVEASYMQPAAPQVMPSELPLFSLWPDTYFRSIITTTERIPKGELAIRRFLVAKAIDGPVGHVESFVVDPANDRITHVVVRTDHVLSRQEVAVPASEMATIVDHAVLLRLDRRGVEELPHDPLHEISPLPGLNPADRDLVAEHPRAAGLADPDDDASHLEGAHLLADEAADRLLAAGLTEDQILSWAKAFLRARHAGDVDEFITWIHEREHRST